MRTVKDWNIFIRTLLDPFTYEFREFTENIRAHDVIQEKSTKISLIHSSDNRNFGVPIMWSQPYFVSPVQIFSRLVFPPFKTRGGLVVGASFQPEGQWFEPGLCRRVVSLDKKLRSTLSLSTKTAVYMSTGVNAGRQPYDGLASHLEVGAGGVATLSVASCYRNRVRLRQL